MSDENIASVGREDSAMLAAIDEARASIKVFLDALMSPTRKQSTFLVKIAFVSGDAVEHIWLADLRFGGTQPTGVIANPPLRKDLKFKQRVPIDFTYLSDWTFVDDQKLVGGYTTRLLRSRMDPEERARTDAEMPFIVG